MNAGPASQLLSKFLGRKISIVSLYNPVWTDSRK